MWFSYDVKSGSLTYLLLDCTQDAKRNILNRAQEDPTALISCPFAVDVIIMKDSCYSWRDISDRYREQLLYWVSRCCDFQPMRESTLTFRLLKGR